MSYICSVITNIALSIFRGKDKQQKKTSPADFLLEWDKEENKNKEVKGQSVEEMKRILKQIAGRFNKKKGK